MNAAGSGPWSSTDRGPRRRSLLDASIRGVVMVCGRLVARSAPSSLHTRARPTPRHAAFILRLSYLCVYPRHPVLRAREPDAVPVHRAHEDVLRDEWDARRVEVGRAVRRAQQRLVQHAVEAVSAQRRNRLGERGRRRAASAVRMRAGCACQAVRRRTRGAGACCPARTRGPPRDARPRTSRGRSRCA